MITKTLGNGAQNIINSYLHFSNGMRTVSVPYFNNRRSNVRAGLRAHIGKGSVLDIRDELRLYAFREHADVPHMTEEEFKKYLVEHNLGIDCSGFAFYVLNEVSKDEGKGPLRSHLAHPLARNVIRKIISHFRCAENTGVTTFAHPDNSKIIPLSNVKPGDFISITHDKEHEKYNHIIIIHKVDYEENTPTILYYSHSMAWPSDGEYNHGVRQGTVTITNIAAPLKDQSWSENGKQGKENYTHERIINAAHVELRRLNWL